MKFSIIIPAYKINYLKEAIESVVKQSFKDFELLIFDDCSPHDIKSLANEYIADKRVKYFRNKSNYGAARLVENWNNALSYCKGDFVICMGDDDRLTPNCLEIYAGMIERNPEISVFHGQTEIIDESSNITEYLEPRFEKESVWQLIYYRWAGLGRQQFIGDFCYKREALIKDEGFFNLPLAWGSDDITACIAASKNGIVNSKETCFQYRKNRHTISSTANTDIKIKALQLQRKWYEDFIIKQNPTTENEIVIRSLLLKLLPQHFEFHTKIIICNDLKGNKCRLLHWLSQHKSLKLSKLQIFKQFIKAMS